MKLARRTRPRRIDRGRGGRAAGCDRSECPRRRPDLSRRLRRGSRLGEPGHPDRRRQFADPDRQPFQGHAGAVAAAGALSRNSLTTAIWPSRWSRLPPFPAATIRGVLPFASGPSTLAHGPAKTAPRGFARRRYLQTAFAGWGRSSLSRRRYSRAFGSGPALKKIAQRSDVSRCDGRAEIVGRGLLSRGASRAHTNLRLFHIIYTT
jgi:hypothetical protein